LLDPRSLKRLFLLVVLVLCFFAFVLVSSGVAWAEEQPNPTVQQRTVEGKTAESTTMDNGVVIGTVPEKTSPAVGGAPVETPLAENPSTPPSYPAFPTQKPEPAPEPTPLRQAVVITAGEVELAPEPTSAPTQVFKETAHEPTPTTPSDQHTSSPELVVVDTAPAPTLEDTIPTPDLGPSATEVPARMTVEPSPPWELEPTSPPGAIQPIQRVEQLPLTHLISTNLAHAADVAANVRGTIGSSVTETPTPDSDAPTGGITPGPLAPLALPPFGDNYLSLLYGGSLTGAGGGSALLLPLWGVCALVAILLRRNSRTYLISCEAPKPSSALLSPLERPG
jgi:hypothetical protein